MADKSLTFGQTGLSPDMQDYHRFGAVREGARLEEINTLIARERVGKLAEIGAQRLSGLGPRGEEWAKRLIADPRGTMEYADKYHGGMANIEAQIAMGQAVGTDREAQALYENYAPKEVQAYRSGLVDQQGANTADRNADTSATEATNIDRYRMGSLGVDQRMASVAEQELPIKRMQAEAARATASNAIALKPRELFNYIGRPRQEEMEGFNEAADVMKQLVVVDPYDPNWAPTLLASVEKLNAAGRSSNSEIAGTVREWSGNIAGRLSAWMAGRTNLDSDERLAMTDQLLQLGELITSEAPQAMRRYETDNVRYNLDPQQTEYVMPRSAMNNVAEAHFRSRQAREAIAARTGKPFRDPWAIYSNGQPNPFLEYDPSYAERFGVKSEAPASPSAGVGPRNAPLRPKEPTSSKIKKPGTRLGPDGIPRSRGADGMWRPVK